MAVSAAGPVAPANLNTNSTLTSTTAIRLLDAHTRELINAGTLHWSCICKSDARAPFQDWQFPIPFQLCRQHLLTCLHSCPTVPKRSNNQTQQHSQSAIKRNIGEIGGDYDDIDVCKQELPSQQQQLLLRQQVINSDGQTATISRRVVNQRQHTNLHQHEEQQRPQQQQQKQQQVQNQKKDASLHNQHQKQYDQQHSNKQINKKKKIKNKDKEKAKEEQEKQIKNIQIETEMTSSPALNHKPKKYKNKYSAKATAKTKEKVKGGKKGHKNNMNEGNRAKVNANDKKPKRHDRKAQDERLRSQANVSSSSNSMGHVLGNESENESYWSLSLDDSSQQRNPACVAQCRKSYPCGTSMAPAYHDLAEYMKDSVAVGNPKDTSRSKTSKAHRTTVGAVGLMVGRMEGDTVLYVM
ncbi:hypothetical protein BGX27_000598, partial [Mortierella sp. AM989]